LPARNETDEIAATMLAQLVEASGFRVETISQTVLTGELADLIVQRQADAVCISAMPPRAATHARYLCKRLQGKFPEERLIVGLWNAPADLAKARTHIGCSDTVRVVGTLTLAQEQIRLVRRIPTGVVKYA